MSNADQDAALSLVLDRLAEAQERDGDDMPVSALTVEETRCIAADIGCSVRQVEMAALVRHIFLERYRRNLGTVGWDGQVQLLQSTVAVVGAGGLGGWVIEVLARMGVGRLIVIDGDRFEENNLNRQIGCTEETLGQLKADCLRERVSLINGAVDVEAIAVWLTAENATDLLHGAQVVIDALDTLPARMILFRAARTMGVPMVHGAIGGYTGQVMTILPGDSGLEALYGSVPRPERGVEVEQGNPSATPMMVSAWQAQEVVKLLTGQGELLRNRMLLMDARFGQVTEVRLG